MNSVYKRFFTFLQSVDFVFSFVRRMFATIDLYRLIKGAPEDKVVYGSPSIIVNLLCIKHTKRKIPQRNISVLMSMNR